MPETLDELVMYLVAGACVVCLLSAFWCLVYQEIVSRRFMKKTRENIIKHGHLHGDPNYPHGIFRND